MPINPNTNQLFPIRKPLNHRGPLSIDTANAIYFITITAKDRGTSVLLDHVDDILATARFYQNEGKWFLHLFLVMPDHLHFLVRVPPTRSLADVIGHWKSFLTTKRGIHFQENFFDTRIRDAEHFAEKWQYVCRNPVTRGLVSSPKDWPHVIAFDPQTGAERPRK